jgi:ABC-2 type transport system permease protein
MRELNAISVIAYRDLMKFLRDPARLVATFVFPVIFIAALGGSMQANLGRTIGYNFMAFTFTGVFAQTLFQSSAFGIISLIQDRENDFSQELFVSPVSRYSIIFGKICGESLVALAQGLAIVIFGIIVGVPLSVQRILSLLPVALAVSLFGGAFGILVLSNLKSLQAADQVFNFIMLPQYFLAGVFNPIQILPPYLEVLSRISPLRYAVDLARAVYYQGNPDYPRVVLGSLFYNTALIAVVFVLFLVVGTVLFVRGERNR